MTLSFPLPLLLRLSSFFLFSFAFYLFSLLLFLLHFLHLPLFLQHFLLVFLLSFLNFQELWFPVYFLQLEIGYSLYSFSFKIYKIHRFHHLHNNAVGFYLYDDISLLLFLHIGLQFPTFLFHQILSLQFQFFCFKFLFTLFQFLNVYRIFFFLLLLVFGFLEHEHLYFCFCHLFYHQLVLPPLLHLTLPVSF